jgi:hypothetical protein
MVRSKLEDKSLKSVSPIKYFVKVNFVTAVIPLFQTWHIVTTLHSYEHYALSHRYLLLISLKACNCCDSNKPYFISFIMSFLNYGANNDFYHIDWEACSINCNKFITNFNRFQVRYSRSKMCQS